jgi:catechol 2,3-dioxygenase-like lactoylglutathione lyase family enzyme
MADTTVTLPLIHHVALTVTDVDVSVPWYEKVFGIAYRTEIPHQGGTGLLLSDPDRRLMVVLHRHDANPGETFSERATGLDHVGFRVASRAELEAWQTHLAGLGVKQVETADQPYTQSPITDAPYASVLVFRDPDNIQLELFAPPGS